jgi:hypothetical protein
VRPTRRTQPYRELVKGRGSVGPAGPARRAMRRGRTAAGLNPMDARRRLARGGRLARKLAGLR